MFAYKPTHPEISSFQGRPPPQAGSGSPVLRVSAKRWILTLSATGAILGLAPHGYTQTTDSWIGGTSTAWATAANWTPGVPTSATIASFDSSFTGANQPTITNTSESVGTLVFAASLTQDVTLDSGSGTLTLYGLGGSSLGINNLSSQAITISSKLALNAAQTWEGNSFSVTGNLNNGGNLLTLNPNSGNTITLDSITSGAGGLTQAGTGTVTLVKAQTYSGATTINSGATLQLGDGSNNGTIASTSGITDNGALSLDESGSVTVAADITGMGAITQNSTNSTTLSGNNSYSGTTTINTGTLKAGSTSAFGGATGLSAVTLNNSGVLALTGNSNTVGSIASASSSTSITLGSGGVLTTGGDNTSDTFAGVISGAGGLTVAGTGTFTLTNAATYTQATTINSGATLQLGNGATNATIASSNSIVDNGTLVLDENTGVTVAKIISGTGGVTQNGTVGNILSGANTYSGATIVNSGTLAAGSTSAFGGATGLSAVTLGGGATLGLNTFSNTVGSIASASTTSSINLGAGSAVLTTGGDNTSTTFSGVISGTGTAGLAKAGTGTLTLGNANTYSGATTINAGTLAFGAANVLGTANALVINGSGTLSLGNFIQSIGTISGTGAIDFGTSTASSQLTLNANSTFSGSFAGTGTLIVGSGVTLTLGADFTDSSLNIELNGGTLDLNGNNGVFGSLIVQGGSSIDFNSGANSSVEFQNVSMSGGSPSLSVTNWRYFSDYFYSVAQSPANQGSAPLSDITFTGYTGNQTIWDTAANTEVGPDGSVGQIRPIIPEPGAYGALFVGLSLPVLLFRGRLRPRRQAGDFRLA